MPERQCAGCKNQDVWGCYATPYKVVDKEGVERTEWHQPAGMPLDLLGEETWACPRQPLREEPRAWGKLLKLYAFYRKGHLPDRGAVVDQANGLLEMFRIMDDANGQCDEAQTEKPQETPRPR